MTVDSTVRGTPSIAVSRHASSTSRELRSPMCLMGSPASAGVDERGRKGPGRAATRETTRIDSVPDTRTGDGVGSGPPPRKRSFRYRRSRPESLSPRNIPCPHRRDCSIDTGFGIHRAGSTPFRTPGDWGCRTRRAGRRRHSSPPAGSHWPWPHTGDVGRGGGSSWGSAATASSQPLNRRRDPRPSGRIVRWSDTAGRASALANAANEPRLPPSPSRPVSTVHRPCFTAFALAAGAWPSTYFRRRLQLRGRSAAVRVRDRPERGHESPPRSNRARTRRWSPRRLRWRSRRPCASALREGCRTSFVAALGDTPSGVRGDPLQSRLGSDRRPTLRSPGLPSGPC
jgi:hypothetical protein